jgi:cobalt transporter subunit CbtB
MAATTETVHARLTHVQTTTTPTQLVAALLLMGAVGFTLLFAQEPVLHDSMHQFRHAAGITCH